MRKKVLAVVLTVAMIMSCSTLLCFAARSSESEHFYIRDHEGNIYNDGDTIDIPLGNAAFLIIDNTYQQIDGKRVHPYFFGSNKADLENEKFYLVYGNADDLGFGKFNLNNEYGIRLDTAYLECRAGAEFIFKYWLTEDKEPHEWDAPGLKLQTLRIRITGRSEEAQPNVSKAKTALSVAASKKTVKAKTVRKKAVAVMPLTAKVGADEFYPCYAELSYKKVSGKSCLTVNGKSGKVTVKKGTKKGTYTAKIKVMTDSGLSKIFDEPTVTKKVTVIVK